jgi:hypothetical protein
MKDRAARCADLLGEARARIAARAAERAALMQRLGARRRRPPEAGIAVPAVPPRGPLPMLGGAAASLRFGGE